MKLFNYHLISDAEYRRIRQIDLSLKRKFSPEQIAAILDGKAHIARNPNRKKAAQ